MESGKAKLAQQGSSTSALDMAAPSSSLAATLMQMRELVHAEEARLVHATARVQESRSAQLVAESRLAALQARAASAGRQAASTHEASCATAYELAVLHVSIDEHTRAMREAQAACAEAALAHEQLRGMHGDFLAGTCADLAELALAYDELAVVRRYDEAQAQRSAVEQALSAAAVELVDKKTRLEAEQARLAKLSDAAQHGGGASGVQLDQQRAAKHAELSGIAAKLEEELGRASALAARAEAALMSLQAECDRIRSS